MTTRATITKGYKARLGIIGLALLIFAGWSAYDGFVYWPKLIEKYEVFQQVAEDNQPDYFDAWAQKAEEMGWEAEPEPDKKVSQDLISQYVIMGITLPLGLYFMYSFIACAGRFVEVSEDTLSANGGRIAKWDQIKSIDKTRWKNKGIAVVHYETDAGEQSITLDDWKFDRDATIAILSEVEARTGIKDETEDEQGESEPTEEIAEEMAQENTEPSLEESEEDDHK